jgi:GxxExxY protein
VVRQHPLPVRYEDVELDAGYRLDLIVESQVIVELKSVEKIIPLYTAQVLSYLRLSKLKVGLLLNFNVVSLKDGIQRLVN